MTKLTPNKAMKTTSIFLVFVCSMLAPWSNACSIKHGNYAGFEFGTFDPEGIYPTKPKLTKYTFHHLPKGPNNCPPAATELRLYFEKYHSLGFDFELIAHEHNIFPQEPISITARKDYFSFYL